MTNAPPRAAPFWGRLGLALILLVALGLRVFRLGYQELRGDEAFGFFFGGSSFSEIVRSTIALAEPHPVGSYFVQKVWMGVSGPSEFALRLISAWFGVLSVALLYRLGRRLIPRMSAAVLGAGLLAVSPYAIWHSQDARMYSISLALTLASTLLAVEAVCAERPVSGHSRSKVWPLWAGYVLVSLSALHVHYYAGFIILAQNLFVLGLAIVDTRYRRVAIHWLMAQAALALLYLPWLILARSTLAGYRGNGDSPGLGAMLQRSLGVFAVGESFPAGRRTFLALLAGGLLALGGVRLALTGERGRRALWLLALYLAVPLLVTWLGALGRPIFNERYLIAAVPPFYLLLAVAAAGARDTRDTRDTREPDAAARNRVLAWAGALGLFLVLAAGCWSLANYYADPAYSKTRGWRELAATLVRFTTGMAPEQVRIAQNFPDPTLWYYYVGPVEHLVLPPGPHDEAGAAQEVAGLAAAGVQRVVMPVQPAGWWDERGIAQAALTGKYTLVPAGQAGGWPVQIYVRPPFDLPPPAGGEVEFSNALTLSGADLQSSALTSGGAAIVTLRWRGSPEEALTGGEKISLQLLRDGGPLIAQTDVPLDASEIRAPETTYSILLPAQLSPGAYRLIVVVYDPKQPGAPRWRTASGADHVDLGALRVP